MVQLQIKIDAVSDKHTYTLDILKDADGYTDGEVKEAEGIKSAVTSYLIEKNNDLKEVNI
jgi:hypothetical protein